MKRSFSVGNQNGALTQAAFRVLSMTFTHNASSSHPVALTGMSRYVNTRGSRDKPK